MSKKEWEHKFHTGNVIEDPEGYKWIVSAVHAIAVRPSIEAISFDSENCSAVQMLEDHERSQTCHCESYTGDGEYAGNDPECEHCKGSGSVIVQVKGWKRSKVLADHVQDYILKHMKKTFNL